LNILFGYFIALSSLFATPDANGWAAVEKPRTDSAFEHAGDEDDPSIWVIFSKRLGAESFMVRFPEDPKYTYHSPDELEMTASRGAESYRLTVLESSLEALDQRAKAIALQPGILHVESERTSATTLDLHYQRSGKWVWEHLYLTPHHLYIFQTKSDFIRGDSHSYFIHSLIL
jgi:hypothetical protein